MPPFRNLLTAFALFCFAAHADDILSRLSERTKLKYPPIALAAHVEGTVTVKVSVNAAGRVISAKAIDGPGMLKSAAEETVRDWKFKPAASGIQGDVSIVFELPNKRRDSASIEIAKRDAEVQARYFPLSDKCSNSRKNPSKEEAATICVKAAETASEFPNGTRWQEKKSAYLRASEALLAAQHSIESLQYADMAVAASENTDDDNAGRMGAYSNRGLVRAVAGKYDEALTDFEHAEKECRMALEWAATTGDHHAFYEYQYGFSLFWTLMYHAKTLETMGRTDEAQAKSTEAAALKAKLDNTPRPQMP